MATITFSPGLVKAATDYLTDITTTTYSTLPESNPTTYQSGDKFRSRLFCQRYQSTGGNVGTNYTARYSTIEFKDSGGTVLATTTFQYLTRILADDGYAIYTGWPAINPSVTGQIDQIIIRDAGGNISYYYAGEYSVRYWTNPYTVQLTVGDVGSGADLEIANRNIVVGTPWELDGSIKFRIPDTYTYSA